MSNLPIEEVLTELLTAARSRTRIILTADPGAGKTTRVPIAFLDESWLGDQKILMLEPRRLAAQRAANYMAHLLGEKVGETVGYRIRGEHRIGKRTRLEVVTEGILTRLLQSDASLPGVGMVIFDEFHERSIHADLGLALTLNAQEHLRPDLRVLVMSATLETESLSSMLGDAVLIKSAGRAFPVETHYAVQAPTGHLEPGVVSTIQRAYRDEAGDILVFLPGQREIRRVESLLSEIMNFSDDESSSSIRHAALHTLFGDAPPERQQAALMPGEGGRRKIILATSIAETSLTIDGVRVVIDAGLTRSSRFDPRRGMSGLVTSPVSRASADQRRGRAGRQQAGACYRLWTERQHAELLSFSPPEILAADLAPLALELARWGTPHGEGLRFLDPPPVAHLAQARGLLTMLNALTPEGTLTPHGHEMADLPVHPRFAHMLLAGKKLGYGALACDVVAMLEERDLLRGKNDSDIDLHSRWYALRKGPASGGDYARVRSQSARLRESIGVRDDAGGDDRLGVLLALAYPERVAKRRDADGSRYQMVGGAGAVLPKDTRLAREKYLAVGDVDGVGAEAKIFLAEPIAEEDVRKVFADHLVIEEEVRWDERQESVVARQLTRLGEILISEQPLTNQGEETLRAMVSGIRMMGLDVLPWNNTAISMRTRSEWLRNQNIVATDWPALSNDHLLSTLDEWLAPYLDGVTRRSHLARLDMTSILNSLFTYEQLRQIDRLAPTHLVVPTGSHIAVEYTVGSQPILAVRLQEMFGQVETPRVADGKVSVLLHLLSPARRPLAVTQDLPSFWKNAYHDVRKDMRGRYPRHYWPENPQEAEPTRKTKRGMERDKK